MSKKFKFTIDRNRWARGGVPEETQLRNNHGMCCLGFAALACGYDEETITGKDRPEDLVNLLIKEGDPEAEANRWFDGLVYSSSKSRFDTTKIGDVIIECNDESTMPDHDREVKLTELFAKLGVEVEFTG